MANKQPRHQAVISRQSDADHSDEHWLREFENKLQKTSVQPRGESVYDQITSIMNTNSKYPSVQAAVDDMMQRSGLSNYLDNVKQSQEEIPVTQPRKIAQQQQPTSQNTNNLPKVIKEKPSIFNTLENIIKDSRGNMPLPAIIARLHSLHARDISDEGAWEDENLIRLVSQLNLQAKKDNPGNFENFDQLGQGDRSASDSDIDSSNTDAFHALLPAKI